MKNLLIVLFFSVPALFAQSSGDFDKYKNLLMDKCKTGDSASCTKVGVLIDSVSKNEDLYFTACSEGISDACYKLAKQKEEKKVEEAVKKPELAKENITPPVPVAANCPVCEVKKNKKPILEVSGATASGFEFLRAGGNNDFSFALNAGIGIIIIDYLQLSIDPFFALDSWDSYAFGLAVGPVFNSPFSDDIRDAVFFSLKAAILYAKVNSASDTSFGFIADFGKRFRISETFTFKPYIEAGFFLDPSMVAVSFMPVSFSGFF